MDQNGPVDSAVHLFQDEDMPNGMGSVATLDYPLRNCDQYRCFDRTGTMDLEHLFRLTRLNAKGNQSLERIRRCATRAQVGMSSLWCYIEISNRKLFKEFRNNRGHGRNHARQYGSPTIRRDGIAGPWA
jgi:hypothetical protein